MSPLAEQLRLLTVEELAEVCGTGEDWIRKGCQARRYEFTMVGRSYRFTRAQAEAIIASKAVPAQGAPTRDEVAAQRTRARRRAA